MVWAFAVGAVVVRERLIVFPRLNFGDQFRAEGLRVAVLFGSESGEGEIVAEGAGFHDCREIPEGSEAGVGQLERVEAQGIFVGEFEDSLFRAAAGDDSLGSGVVVGGGSAGLAFGGADHAFDVIFAKGAEVEVQRNFFTVVLGTTRSTARTVTR